MLKIISDKNGEDGVDIYTDVCIYCGNDTKNMPVVESRDHPNMLVNLCFCGAVYTHGCFSTDLEHSVKNGELYRIESNLNIISRN